MSKTVIKVENLSKRYQLGTFGYGSLQHDLAAFWARMRGKEDPNTKIGEVSRFDRHGEFWALKDLSFEVKQGDRLGILGRNGAGKSTLLKILSRVTSPTEGRVKIRGRVASLLEVGTGFNPELTGRENVYLNGAIMGMKRFEIRRKFDEIVDFSGIPQFIDTPVKRYSSGMKVKLAFAVAAHLDSEILIADEVLAVGDAEFQKKSLGKMEDISTNQGRTVLFVSHNIPAVESLCLRGIVLIDGKLAIDQTITESLMFYRQQVETVPDLSDPATVRHGEGNLRVVSARIKTESGLVMAGSAVKMGEKVEFQLDIAAVTSFVGRRFEVNLLIESDAEVRLIPLSDRLTLDRLVAPSPRFSLRCSIPGGLPLLPGRYSLTVSLVCDDVTQDKVVRFLPFWVENFVSEENTAILGQNLGRVFVKHSFRLEPIQTEYGLKE